MLDTAISVEEDTPPVVTAVVMCRWSPCKWPKCKGVCDE